jgi:energy-coupling factor transporter ATP-binding protein EcfA2
VRFVWPHHVCFVLWPQVPVFVTERIQFFDTLNVRFGVMLVGPTGGGKTTSINMLQQAMSQLRTDEHRDKRYQLMHKYMLNPKCIDIDALFGKVDKLIPEWVGIPCFACFLNLLLKLLLRSGPKGQQRRASLDGVR